MFVSKPEIASIVTHVMNSYFANYNLYRCTSCFQPGEEFIPIQVTIDEPSPIEPLSEAVMVARGATEEDG